jgi:hypothetical protein
MNEIARSSLSSERPSAIDDAAAENTERKASIWWRVSRHIGAVAVKEKVQKAMSVLAAPLKSKRSKDRIPHSGNKSGYTPIGHLLSYGVRGAPAGTFVNVPSQFPLTEEEAICEAEALALLRSEEYRSKRDRLIKAMRERERQQQADVAKTA